jgi:hypothetical protein
MMTVVKTSAELATQLTNFTNVPFRESVRNSRFITPISNLRRTLRNKSPILLELIESREVLRIFLRSTFRSFPANPNKQSLIDQFNATYAIDAPNTSNGHNGFSEIAKLLTNTIRSETHTALVGARGSGKTAFVNKYLNDHTKGVFESELGYAWFRIDAEKVYDIQEQHDFIRDKATLANYFAVHSVYVFFRYSGILLDTAGESDQFNHVRSRIDATLSQTDLKVWKRSAAVLRKHYEKIPRPESDFVSETFVASAFRKNNASLFDWSMKAWAILSRTLNREGVGILCIIDGIDNISWSKDSVLYTRMCADAKEFIGNLKVVTGNVKAKILLVSRPETIPELEVSIRRHGYSHPVRSEAQFACVELVNAEARTVLRRKVQATISSPEFAQERGTFQRRLDELRVKDVEIETPQALLSEMQKIGNGYLSYVVEDINRVQRYILNAGGKPVRYPLTDERAIGDVFDNDLRSLLDCFVLLNRARSIASRQEVVGAQEPSRFLEYLLLAGKNYLESAPVPGQRRYQKIPRGEIFPNIFWYDTKDALQQPAVWHGLAGYRMLQCADKLAPVTGGDLIYMLREMFGYSQDVLIEHLEAFVAYGLLNVEFHDHRVPAYCPATEKEHRYGALLSISDKGLLIKALSLAYVDWVYFLALDTPMHFEEVEDSKRVKFYVHPFVVKDRYAHFFEAYCPTVATFARHVVQYCREEHATLRNNFEKMNQKFPKVVTNNEVLLQWFELPKTFIPILRSEISSAITARRRELQNLPNWEIWDERYMQELEGTFADQ